ncbi:hypothetical protein LZU96_23125 (plasmid) [Pantoea agglomerans]|uniref:hypothetical protein n=1 Tax=Enterobacter agglomerans TaxID=549 RepID=UPI001F24E65C|nr:hypothetical protein [Pantoea agglomerans]UIL55057.1 hypothetical protein LZU96_23125 [Pantoea agglomerans]
MKITYDEISSESKLIVNAMSSSQKVVPSAFHPLKRVLGHFLLYMFFCLISYISFALKYDDSKGEWFLFFGFGFLNWLFIFAFFYGYEVLFSMIDEKKVDSLKIVKIMKGKVKHYGLAWAVLIILLGVGSAITELNVALLVVGNFVGSILLMFVFNMDISRYQVSAIVGAISAVKDNIKR